MVTSKAMVSRRMVTCVLFTVTQLTESQYIPNYKRIRSNNYQLPDFFRRMIQEQTGAQRNENLNDGLNMVGQMNPALPGGQLPDERMNGVQPGLSDGFNMGGQMNSALLSGDQFPDERMVGAQPGAQHTVSDDLDMGRQMNPALLGGNQPNTQSNLAPSVGEDSLELIECRNMNFLDHEFQKPIDGMCMSCYRGLGTYRYVLGCQRADCDAFLPTDQSAPFPFCCPTCAGERIIEPDSYEESDDDFEEKVSELNEDNSEDDESGKDGSNRMGDGKKQKGYQKQRQGYKKQPQGYQKQHESYNNNKNETTQAKRRKF